MPDVESVTLLLRDARAGDKAALDLLVPLVYGELHTLADGYLRRERSDHTLQPTALVHELYLRLFNQNQPDFENRTHFYGVAARVMRQILVDHARSRAAAKRGSNSPKLPLEEALVYAEERAAEMIALDDALSALEQHDPQKARLVELRYFGGLTAEESAALMGMTPQAVYRHLRLAQAWLRCELERSA